MTAGPTGFNPTRRSYLKLVGGTTGASILATSNVRATSSDDEYDRIVDVVEEGADNSGDEPVDSVIEEHERDGTLLEFPDGRYLVNGFNFFSRQNFGLRATGDAELVPGDYEDREVWIGGSSMRDFLFEGFSLDTTEQGVAPTIAFHVSDGLEVRNIYKRGYHDGKDTAFGFSITEADGSGVIENLQLPDGSIPNHPVGIYVRGDGSITFRNCHVEGFGNNGLYASVCEGPVQVLGGLYRNNDRSNVRLGRSDSTVRGTRIEVTRARDLDENLRGVRVSDGSGQVTIEDCEILMTGGHGMGGIVNAYNGGSIVVRDTHIAVANEYRNFNDTRTGYAVLVQDDSKGITGTRQFENVTITGDAWSGPTVSIRRDNATFRNCCFHHERERDGIGFQNTPQDILVEDSTIDVAGDAFVGEADLETRNVSYSGGCSDS